MTDWYSADAGALYKGAQLLVLDAPGTADDKSAHFVGETAPPGYFTVYAGFPALSPDGGNFIGADGDPWFHESLNQIVSGLTVGRSYKLSFYQAAAQQDGQLGPTTEQWQVSFGNDTQFSRMVSLPEAGVSPWERVTMTFTASSNSQLLSFLAQGTPNGAPPISFLDGVSLTAVPEPATWAMMIGGFALIGAAMRRRSAPVQAALAA